MDVDASAVVELNNLSSTRIDAAHQSRRKICFPDITRTKKLIILLSIVMIGVITLTNILPIMNKFENANNTNYQSLCSHKLATDIFKVLLPIRKKIGNDSVIPNQL